MSVQAFGEGELRQLYKELGVREHPVWKLPALSQVLAFLAKPEGRGELVEFLQERSRLMGLAEADPRRYGVKPDNWKHAREILEKYSELLIMGGNRSGKTEFAADYACNDLCTKPKRTWAFLHSSHDSCIRQQHPRIYKYLPPEWRDLGKVGKSIYVEFKEKTGFTDGVFILPNGSRGFFFNYMQDPKVLEGEEFDGAWADELVPPPFIDALRYRLQTRRGKLLVTFTPVTGYTASVAQYLSGATVVRSAPSPLLPGANVPEVPNGEMPVELACTQKRRRVLFFFTQNNPFNPYDEMVQTLEGQPAKEIKMRAYGWPEKQVGSAFPKFGKVNILKRAVCPPGYVEAGLVPPRPWEGKVKREAGSVKGTGGGDFRREDGTRESMPAGRAAGSTLGEDCLPMYPGLPRRGTNYVVADPAPSKNWVIKWYRVGAEPEHSFIYREWPDVSANGWWALPSDKADGKPGPAQRNEYGRGIVEYKRLILMAEGWVWNEDRMEWDGRNAEKIEERFIDPRGGGVEVPTIEEGTSIIALMEEEQFDQAGHLIGPSMIWIPAATNRQVEDGIELVNDRFDYKERDPVSIMNCPKLYVVEDCWQSIYGFREYTGLDGQKGALKDVVDPDRYFCKQDLGHVESEGIRVRTGRGF